MKPHRSSHRQDQRRTSNVTLIICSFLCLYLLFLFKSYYHPKWNVQKKGSSKKSSHSGEDALCDLSGSKANTCDVDGETRVNISSSTISFLDQSAKEKRKEWRIRPYANKEYLDIESTKEWLLQSSPTSSLPHCTTAHSGPVVVFSSGGLMGDNNIFRDFTDVIIPLFISSNQFDRDVHLIADCQPSWFARYVKILRGMSKHPIIKVEEREGEVHCFRRAIVGPTFHAELGVDVKRTPGGYSIMDFKKLLGKTLWLKREQISTPILAPSRPRLLILARNSSRVLLNQKEVEAMAKNLGYEVFVKDPDEASGLTEFARFVNSVDVLVGVYGSGLTNMLFLPTGAVVVVIVPFGSLHWFARTNYGDPATEMGVRYLEYQVEVEESSLADDHSANSDVLKNPQAVHNKGFLVVKDIYMNNQNVRPHLPRLNKTLLEALDKLRA